MLSTINLLTAPTGYIPEVETTHNELTKEIRQTFKGGRVVFTVSKITCAGEAKVDGRSVGHWEDMAVGDWGNILYTLSKKFNYLIH
ncbi:MAG: hypothetical protein LKI53_02500 [Bacteroidales bacterium]|jgi:hypothetical protein|nr:hypothetical protein [Bacteroidales bacterium]